MCTVSILCTYVHIQIFKFFPILSIQQSNRYSLVIINVVNWFGWLFLQFLSPFLFELNIFSYICNFYYHIFALIAINDHRNHSNEIRVIPDNTGYDSNPGHAGHGPYKFKI